MSIVLVAASLAAAVIHLALGPEHVAELGWLGAGFYFAGGLQLGWSVLAALESRRQGARGRARTRVLLRVGIAINVAILAAWFVSRTVGLPAGEHPWTPEQIGVSDAIAAMLEGGLVVGLARASRRGSTRSITTSALPGRGYPALLGAAPVLALILVAAVTAIGATHAHADGGAHDASSDAVEAEPYAH